MSRPFRLAVVNSHPIQYFAPLYAYLSRDSSIDVTAFYCSDVSLRGGLDAGFRRPVAWDIDLLEGYRSVFLGSAAHTRVPGGFWSLVCPQVWPAIRRGNFDAVVIHGYSHAVNVLAALAAKAHGVPVLMRSETHLGLRGNRRRRAIRDFVLSFAYRYIDGFLAIGTANRIYYRSLGVADDRIFDVPYTVENARFEPAAAQSPTARAGVREGLGLRPDRPVVLYASKFLRRKHPDDAIRAIARLRDRGVVASLLMVGTGEMDEELRTLAQTEGLDGVVFTGFVNQSELPRILAAADVFVLPSEDEPWGLIVNEAMCAGLPVVVSSEIGCVPDLVQDGVNGFHMMAGDVDSLVNALDRLLGDAALRERMGAASTATMKRWSYEQCRQGLLDALRHAVPARGLPR